MSEWIKANVPKALIIGPDSESEQWVSTVAKDAGATYTVLEKVRRGDRDVEISVKNLVDLGDRTPVLVDDIISTGRTMFEVIRLLTARGIAPRFVSLSMAFSLRMLMRRCFAKALASLHAIRCLILATR
jgi:ribose-phosphate pyrophosphokinase